MTTTASKLDRYVDLVLRRPWLTMALAAVPMLVMTAGVPRITITNDYREMFGTDNPELAAFETLENTYAESNRALIAVAPQSGTVFSREALGAIADLTDAGWRAPYSSRVDSLTNYTHSEAFEDDLIVEPLVADAQALTDAELADVEQIALSAADTAGRLVSHDGRVGAVAINFFLPDNLDAAVVEITDYLDAIIAEARAQYPDIDYYLTGDVVMNRAFADATVDDITRLMPIVFVVIVVAAAILLRSVPGTVAIVITLMFVVNTTMGLAGWLRTSFSPTKRGRADHPHGPDHGLRGPHRVHCAVEHEARREPAFGDCRIVAPQHAAGVPDIAHDGHRVSESQLVGFAAIPYPRQPRGVWSVLCLWLLHDAAAGASVGTAPEGDRHSRRAPRPLRPTGDVRDRQPHAPAVDRRPDRDRVDPGDSPQRDQRELDTVFRRPLPVPARHRLRPSKT